MSDDVRGDVSMTRLPSERLFELGQCVLSDEHSLLQERAEETLSSDGYLDSKSDNNKLGKTSKAETWIRT